jgi:hypothetical protein
VGVLPVLAERDNQAWLRRFGDPRPYSEATDVEFKRSGPDRWRCHFEFSVHCDVGRSNPQAGVPPLLKVPRYAPPGMPHWSDLVDDYAERSDIVPGRAWYEGPYLVYCYLLGARYTTRQGTDIDTHSRYPALIRGQQEMADSVRVVDRGASFRIPPPANTIRQVGAER